MNAKTTDVGATLAIDIDECRNILRLDATTAPTAELELLIKAATRQLEDELGRSFITKTWTVYYDRFAPSRDPTSDYWYKNVPRDGVRAGAATIEIPRPPLVAITSVKHYDSTNTLQTVSSDDYRVDIHNEPGRIAPSASAVSWPSDVNNIEHLNPIEIIFTAGYGAADTDIPYRIKHAIIMLTGHYWENPEATGVALSEVNPGLWQQVADYKIIKF